MLTKMTEFDRTFDVLDELRRQMDRVWSDYDGSWGVSRAPTQSLSGAHWPRLNVLDAGGSVVVTADVPGMTEKDLDVAIEDNVLTLSGERKAAAPDGYTAHRRERPALRFARSIALPAKVDAEKTSANVKDGVLTITLAKAPEARPRQIAVRVQG